MSNKLKPCPWPSCGSEAVEVQYLDNISVVCSECGANGPVVHPRAAGIVDACQEAARLWNERAGDGAQPEIEYTAISADGSRFFVIENGEVKEYSMGEDYRRLFGEKGNTDEV